MSTPQVDDRGRIDPRSVDVMSHDDLRRWIRDRLRGRDSICADAERSDDMPQYLLKVLYPQLDRSTREDFQGIVLSFLASLTLDPDSEWLGEPGSRLLLLLDPVLVQSPQRAEAVNLLRRIAQSPRFAAGPFPNLHFRALQALVGLRHRADHKFWDRQFRLGGDAYAPVVLEGLALIDASAALDWLAEVPWNEAIADAVEGLLPSLLEDYGAPKIISLIEGIIPQLAPGAASDLERIGAGEGLTIEVNAVAASSLTPSNILASLLALQIYADGSKVKRLRQRKGWTTEELARRAHLIPIGSISGLANPAPITGKVIQAVENGRVTPARTLLAIAVVLGVKFDEIGASRPAPTDLVIPRAVWW
jgi:hypothetical protein